MNHNNRSHIITNVGGDQQPTQSRPSHKTHVEIITKNGATKKPNIIGNNGPSIASTVPDSTTSSSSNAVDSGGPTTSARAENRKVTCMLYLQADHTFYGKMGSEEASIEAITRHVQRANVIYKGTGEYRKALIHWSFNSHLAGNMFLRKWLKYQSVLIGLSGLTNLDMIVSENVETTYD